MNTTRPSGLTRASEAARAANLARLTAYLSEQHEPVTTAQVVCELGMALNRVSPLMPLVAVCVNADEAYHGSKVARLWVGNE